MGGADPATLPPPREPGLPLDAVVAWAGPRASAGGGVRTREGEPIQPSQSPSAGHSWAGSLSSSWSCPASIRRPLRRWKRELSHGAVCSPCCVGQGWHSGGGLFWALLEVGAPSPAATSASKQLGGPKGDVTLPPGVPPFSEQLLASYCVCVGEGGTYILATV